MQQPVIRLSSLIVCILLFVASIPIHAQAPIGPFDVFLNQSADKAQSNIIFLNVRTGLSNNVSTNGIGYTLINSRVLYFDNVTKIARVAYPDGHTEPFAAVEMSDPNATVKWSVSSNRAWISWSVSVLRDQSLIADLFIAKVDGSNRKLVLHTSSTKGVDTVPLAVTDSGAMIFYSRQEQKTQPYQLFPVVSDVFRLDIASGESTELSGKTDCLCAIGFSPDGQLFSRLEAVGGNFSFGAHIWDMSINKDFVITAPKLSHRQAGYLLVSRNRNLIVYTSARGVPPAKGVPPERYAIVLIDIPKQEQRTLATLLENNLRPVAFEADNSAVMLVGADTGGTYKLPLDGGDLRPVSKDTYLGTIDS